jgi:hypothetical protein
MECLNLARMERKCPGEVNDIGGDRRSDHDRLKHNVRVCQSLRPMSADFGNHRGRD